MDFYWDKYKITTKLIIDSPIEYLLILQEKKKLLMTYKSNIKIYNIKSLKVESEITFEGFEQIENLYLLKNGIISICTKNCIFLMELHEDNTYNILQKIEISETQDFKFLIELKNSNLCILSKDKIFVYKLVENKYKKVFILEENYIQHENEKGYNESCIELIYPEKNIENKIAVYLSNVIRLSFWDLNERKKINNTHDNPCNSFDLKYIFCLMNNGKYLLCACIDEAIQFFSTETCEHIKTLYDNYWHVSVLKLNENQILSGGDFGTITFYEFNFEHEEFKNKEIYIDMKNTEKIEKKINIEIPKELEEKGYGHGQAINQIIKFGNSIISSSCYEKNNKSFICYWNKN